MQRELKALENGWNVTVLMCLASMACQERPNLQAECTELTRSCKILEQDASMGIWLHVSGKACTEVYFMASSDMNS